MKGVVKLAAPLLGFFCLLGLLLFGVIMIEEDEQNSSVSIDTGLSVSPEVLKHRPLVEKYCNDYDISEYVNIILAIMQMSCKAQKVWDYRQILLIQKARLNKGVSIFLN